MQVVAPPKHVGVLNSMVVENWHGTTCEVSEGKMALRDGCVLPFWEACPSVTSNVIKTSDVPTVVFLHGAFARGQSFARLWQSLAKTKARLVTYTQRGSADTSQNFPSNRCSVAGLAHDLHEVIHHRELIVRVANKTTTLTTYATFRDCHFLHLIVGLDFGSPVVYVGHSMGLVVILHALQFFGANAMNAARVVNIDQAYGFLCPQSMSPAERATVGNTTTCAEMMALCSEIEEEHKVKSTGVLDKLVRAILSPGFSDAQYAEVRQDILGS